MTLKTEIIDELKDLHNPTTELLSRIASSAKHVFHAYAFERDGKKWKEDDAWIAVVKTVLNEIKKTRM